MKKHSIVNLKCPCFLFRYPNLYIPSQALFNLQRASALPLKCGSEDDQNFQSSSGHSRRPVTWCRYLVIPVKHGEGFIGCLFKAVCLETLSKRMLYSVSLMMLCHSLSQKPSFIWFGSTSLDICSALVNRW